MAAETDSGDALLIRGAPAVVQTAFWTAFCRAEETRAASPIVRDPFAAPLLGDEALGVGRELERVGGAHASIVLRTRVIDERIGAAVAVDGAEEVVLLGCGLDARAYRLALPGHVRFVEVDLPELVAWKRDRLDVIGLRAPRPLVHHAIDLTRADEVASLVASLGARPRVVVLEGVLAYLDPAEARALLDVLARARGSTRLVADVGGGAWSALFGRRIPSLVARRGAPYRTRVSDARGYFERAGWDIESDLSLVDWDAARSEPRLRVPLGARLFGSLRDVARVVDAVPARAPRSTS